MQPEVSELLKYRLNRAKETLKVVKTLLDSGNYKDSNNRSYYAAFYAMKSIYAIKGKDYKKHKTLLANFNREFVATEIFPRSLGRKISMLAIIREQSDYNDFYVASRQESLQQYETAKELIEVIERYLRSNNYLD